MDASLETCSDEALVEQIRREGWEAPDGAAALGEVYRILTQRMRPVLQARAEAGYRSCGGALSREDLLQEAMLGFLSAVSAYRPGQGASFRTFAGVCARNRVASALRAGHAPEEELLENDLPPGAQAMDPQDVFQAMEETRRMMELIQSQLTPLERGVMEGYLAGDRYEEVSARLGIPAKAVDNALQRVRKKLRQLGN